MKKPKRGQRNPQKRIKEWKEREQLRQQMLDTEELREVLRAIWSNVDSDWARKWLQTH